ncbi:MAG TPA: MotA/TolQ/ExbB proton channel family protein [Bacteriovoracaceae bacterium]|nr:MotA/TolQ/ExbB proton channel family protein [Bacteriovoracaceae bacterium]
MRIIDFINAGGSITWILVAMNIIGLSLILWRMFVMRDFKKRISDEAKVVAKEMAQMFQTTSLLSHLELVKDATSRRVHELETGLNTIKVIATTSPLLGLLGTVIGIYEAFQVISSKGLSDPGQFAGGISYALITTIVGLIVAIPHFIAHNYLSGELDSLEIQLEKSIGPMLLKRD